MAWLRDRVVRVCVRGGGGDRRKGGQSPIDARGSRVPPLSSRTRGPPLAFAPASLAKSRIVCALLLGCRNRSL